MIAGDEERVLAIVSTYAYGALELTTLRPGPPAGTVFIEFHLVVPGAITVDAAHDICDRIKKRLQAGFAHALVQIHIKPEGEIKQTGSTVL